MVSVEVEEELGLKLLRRMMTWKEQVALMAAGGGYLMSGLLLESLLSQRKQKILMSVHQELREVQTESQWIPTVMKQAESSWN